MNMESFVYRKKINIAKVLLAGCIFLLVLFLSCTKANALNINITSSTYAGNSGNHDAVTINNIKYIQGSGVSNEDGIVLVVTDAYSSLGEYNAISFWEQSFSSGTEYEDYDRWYIRDDVYCEEDDLADCADYLLKVENNDLAVEDEDGNKIIKRDGNRIYYIEGSPANYLTYPSNPKYVVTVADFSEFFTLKKITYTYRIRNINYIRNGDGFGYKIIQMNLWHAEDGSTLTIPTAIYNIEFGLAKAISDVETLTNKNDTTVRSGREEIVAVDCDHNLYKICVDYSDTNGLPSASTISPATTNIYLPPNILYAHSYTTREQVIARYEDGKVGSTAFSYITANNTTYLLNYFCESDSITLADITYNSSKVHSASCATGSKRNYVYVNGILVNRDVNSVDNHGDSIMVFDNLANSFVAERYNVRFYQRIDAKGNYVVVVRDYFGNTNEVAVFKVMDVINQALIAYFDKSNKTSATISDSDGWKANEYLTNEDVTVKITMSATTVIEQGLPIDPAETTLLDSRYVKEVGYWRVDGSIYDADVCANDATVAQLANCAVLDKTGASYQYNVLYYSSNGISSDRAPEFVSFVGNELSMRISSNGRYRFYIETFANSNTNNNQGENKNPRLEVYKIDKEAPEILFGGSSDSYCDNGTCGINEETYRFYQGTGNVNGSVLNKLVTDSGSSPYKILYTGRNIYYVSANGISSVTGSALSSTDPNQDIFFTYLYALFDTNTYLKENLRKYDTSKVLYAHYDATSVTNVEYVQDFTALLDKYLTMDEDGFETAYREYIIKGNYKFTAFALGISSFTDATNMTLAHRNGANTYTFKNDQPMFEQNRIKIEYLDAVNSDTPVCTKLGALGIDLNGDEAVDQTDCVNYYLDHGIDFKIKITVYDVIQDSSGNYILGNSTTRTIDVDVIDTTTPGFNEEINYYNIGSECRIEIGNVIGKTGTDQTMDHLLNCYGITDAVTTPTYNYEDNVFSPLYSRTQSVNTRAHISTYILGKGKEEGRWVSLDTNTGYTPSRSGNYTILIIIRDDASTTTTFDLSTNTYHDVTVVKNYTVSGDTISNDITVNGNAIAVLVSYYVDKKLVLVTPQTDEKFYGEYDPIFNYCIHVNQNNGNVAAYLNAPFAQMGVFTQIGCTTRSLDGTSVSLTGQELLSLFKDNIDLYNAEFTGILTRQESIAYNKYLYAPTLAGNYYDGNEYVGLYRIVLGSLTIDGDDNVGDDYIIKINPDVRNGKNLDDTNGFVKPNNAGLGEGMYQLHSQITPKDVNTNQHYKNGNRKCNLVDSQKYTTSTGVETASNCYNFSDDDDFLVESNVTFTIKQVILTVTATGSTKIYGNIDPKGTSTSYSTVYDSDGKLYLSSVGVGNTVVESYTVTGLKKDGKAYRDDEDIVLGVLRREIGEDVGVYSICNFRGVNIAQNSLEAVNNMLIVGANDTSDYQNCKYFENKAFATIPGITSDELTALNTLSISALGATYTDGIMDINANYIKSRSLYIKTNEASGNVRTLNVTANTRDNNFANYVINYVENVFEIVPEKLVVQPAPGQRREYSFSGVDEVDPWEIIVYGEKRFTPRAANEGFNGYTVANDVYSNSANDPKSVDTKDAQLDQEHYNNATEDRASWKIVIDGRQFYPSSTSISSVQNFKTNETYTLFEGRMSLVDKTPTGGVYKGMGAGWYAFDTLLNTDDPFGIRVNGRKQCSYNRPDSTVGIALTGDCRNYDLILDLEYRNADGYKDEDTVSGNKITVVYKSKDKYCKTPPAGLSGEVSDSTIQCADEISSQILFEVYRREIIMEFNSLMETLPTNDLPIVYGKRYDYYKSNLFDIDATNKNNFAGKKTLGVENKLFYCYTSYDKGLTGIVGDCTSNKWYGLTENDTWYHIGLEFHLHSFVSSSSSDYYDTSTDMAIPAGRYYVYATISDANYKFTYLGGTFTIKTKATGITLTNYSKEYGNVYYNEVMNNGTTKCFKDGSILNVSNNLIADCLDTTNTIDNTYGFIVDGLDSKDTISDNFIGRPRRDSNLANSSYIYTDQNGLQENVGIYTIRIGTILTISNNINRNYINGVDHIDSCSNNFVADEVNCIVVSSVDIHNYIISSDNTSNYDLTYYLFKNGTEANSKNYASAANTSVVDNNNRTLVLGKLTITPARIDITVTPSQTKMYGCAYNKINTVSSYKYSYDDTYGYYDCIETTGSDYDLGYEYTVLGDKDYYIYNNGYYNGDYNSSTTYTSSRIKDVVKSGVVDRLLIAEPSRVGLRSSALNGGVLYRVNFNRYSSSISYASLISAADNAQAATHYQGQSVGSYIITLGNLNATLTSDLSNYGSSNSATCDASNNPVDGGSLVCRNYIIYYYTNNTITSEHHYSTDSSADTTFTITPRVAFIYTNYSSKVYGNADPDVSCETNDNHAVLAMGLNCYYTKNKSLAKAPWVASIDVNKSSMINKEGISFTTTSNDLHEDVVSGKLSRVGMNNGVKDIDDIVDTYNYLYTSVIKTSYSSSNYNLNYYLREFATDSTTYPSSEIKYLTILNGNVSDSFVLDTDNYDQYQAVDSDGDNLQVVDGKNKKVLFEINLRKITVKLVDFKKVYGIQDDDSFFELAICATGDEEIIYDAQGNAKCQFVEGTTSTQHGLSASHKTAYRNVDGTLNQAAFRTAFKVWFARAWGENVTCASRSNETNYCLDNTAVSNSINGYFASTNVERSYDTTFSYTLNFTLTGYEALGFINQQSGELGYNYEITYVVGEMTIIPRTILITPDSGQGFQYGSYTYPTLIPSITYTNSLLNHNYVDANKKVVMYKVVSEDTKVAIVSRNGTVTVTNIDTNEYGLVRGDDTATECLKNINSANPHTFCINDRQDTYSVNNTEKTTSIYTYNNRGTVTSSAPTYVFGDDYKNEESTRSALNRQIGSSTDNRYNRNVGIYLITIGDLTDKTGNYSVEFTSGIEYEITPANLLITPDSNQDKIYGEADDELTFTIRTRFIINSSQYIVYDDSIVSIGGVNRDLLVVTDGKTFATSGSEVVLSGYAYYENINSEHYNYGAIKNSNKSTSAAALEQLETTIGKPFDKYCYDFANSTTISDCDATDRTVHHTTTTLVLVGNLYVENYAQRVGSYDIVNGFVVADNEFDNKNYVLSITEHVQFVINKLNIKLAISPITKYYGVATDAYKCEDSADCVSDFALLTANDNEDMLEYNFNIYFKDSDTAIGLTGSDILMVNAIHGNYYTQSEGREHKNYHLGLTVVRYKDSTTTCTLDTDTFGCEDAEEYKLVFRKQAVTNNIDENYNMMVDDTHNITIAETDSSAEIAKHVLVNVTSHNVETGVTSLKTISNTESTLTIQKRSVEIFVNTNLNSSNSNYYEIEQNIEAPTLPTIDNLYNLVGYTYDDSKTYHGIGENASSLSTSANLSSTYTKIVWGDKPHQVRKADALIGEVAYCNQPVSGLLYSDIYPNANELCDSTDKLVYNNNKAIVNTNTAAKFILITRDVLSNRGLKIASGASVTNYSNNNYELKNYATTFYPGAVHVVSDDNDPILVVNTKDYYIEANARYGSTATSSSVGTILEYLFNGADKAYVLASVREDGTMYVSIGGEQIAITSSALFAKYGRGNLLYPGIVSGVEQEEIYPFISDYAHTHTRDENGDLYSSYLNAENMTTLGEFVTTLASWFNVTSYDKGQIINGERLERKFDKYYYIVINKYGYDVAGDINNEFAINKVATYNVVFYVMDNSGRINNDTNHDNIGRLHIIDTTDPVNGELTLYSANVKCDSSCNDREQWYINQDAVSLQAFNRYTFVEDAEGIYEVDSTMGNFVLSADGEYIYLTEVGNTTSPYKKISEVETTTTNYEKFINTKNKKYSAYGVIHYSWSNNASGIYLTITGGSDNSYTSVDDYENTQWSYYYSIDGGIYYVEYKLTNNMNAYRATASDGVRVIKSMTLDNGIKTSIASERYTVSYDVCFEDGCAPLNVPYRTTIGDVQYTFNEGDIIAKSFTKGANKCSINKLGTLITCYDGETMTGTYKLEGNRFTYSGSNYVLAGNNVLEDNDSHGYFAKIDDYSVIINGVTYEFDEVAMKLYKRDIIYFSELTELTKEEKEQIPGKVVTINGRNYLLDTEGNALRECSGICSHSDTEVGTYSNYTITYDGKTYMYVDDASTADGYYLSTTSYTVYNSYIEVGSTDVYFASFAENVYTNNHNNLRLYSYNTYVNSYKLYDEMLLGLTEEYAETGNMTLDPAVKVFRNYITQHVEWNKASDDVGSTNLELENYLNDETDTKYYIDIKNAYLDTTKPTIGLNMYNVVSGTNVRINYGDDWYVYEYGYYNTMMLEDNQYTIRGVTYTVDIANLRVTTSDASYVINEIKGDTDPKYYYTINYTNYYIDNAVTKITWLHSYVERYAGAKDVPDRSDIVGSEVPYYNISASVYRDVDSASNKINADTLNEFTLINDNTIKSNSSGIGGNKYKSKGKSDALFDFIALGRYEDGIYYEDIDYIVWYVDTTQHKVISQNLNTQFKECYLSAGMITQDCAQEKIRQVVFPIKEAAAQANYDITYTINYVVRDKAGNASNYAARGILYATILPSTNIVVNNIPESPATSGVSITSLGNNTYEAVANQGVSLEFLNDAFQVNYATTYRNYNNAAVMTIYKGDELIVENARGVSFIDYIDSSEIADYKIIYNMSSYYTTSLGEDIKINGEQVVLNLSIRSPIVQEDSTIKIESVVNNKSNIPLFAIVIGIITMIAIGGAMVILGKKKNR